MNKGKDELRGKNGMKEIGIETGVGSAIGNRRENGREGKTGEKFLAGGVLLLAAGMLLFAARRFSGFAEWYAVTVYPVLVGSAGRLFGLFPFSIAELGLYGAAAGLFVQTYGMVRKKRRFLQTVSTMFLFLSSLLFLYAACCGVNYYRNPFSSYLERVDGASTRERLLELCEWLGEGANETWLELGETEDSFEHLQQKGVAAMDGLAKEYSFLSGYYPLPKPVLFSWILSVQQCSGVYSPFTIEANYNRDMVSYNIPHTICHELSHLKGFMREDEANFIGYLACMGSDDADYRYSGYLMGWIYAGNALYRVDPEAYWQVYGELSDAVRQDLQENNRFWAQYEGRAAEAAEAVNDAYLKVNGQPEGVETYGRVVDLMLEDFVKNHQNPS